MAQALYDYLACDRVATAWAAKKNARSADLRGAAPMPDRSISLESGHIHLSPVASRIAAQDYFKCYLDFKKPRRFSPVPFFLCCRAIELALKAIHLETKTAKVMKDIYGHSLMKLYRELPKCDLKLSP